MAHNGRKRAIIENVQPETNGGRFPISRVVGEKIIVQADIFSDGHEEIIATLRYRHANEDWQEVPMIYLDNDRWQSEFTVTETGICYYTLQARIDHFSTWQKDLTKKYNANQNIRVDLLIGVDLINKTSELATDNDTKKLIAWAQKIKDENDQDTAYSIAMNQELAHIMTRYSDQDLITTYEKELSVMVDRKQAIFSSWYEMFPRSASPNAGKHGTFKDCERLLPEIAALGFDVLYFPPIHPIGKTNRKGKNNATVATPEDPGSPWAIGCDEGGHNAIHPQLGNMDDFTTLIKKAQDFGIEIAIDLAFQCSPDHPYVKQHPEWFRWRPDGTVQYAENPPKKYEDVLPIHFETENWQELWQGLKQVVLFWVDKGVKIFRVDNPHTKPFSFWEWLIKEVKTDHPDVLFLSEAFTRPKVMYRLAKIGFTQSYTYFTWRNTKEEFIQYLTQLTQSEVREYFRPNFWPNTPDILPEHLQYGGKPAFIIRLVLAATLSSNYGIYGPPFELCITEAVPNKEEYLNSEKYEIKHWDRDKRGNIKELIARVNTIRQENEALQTTWNIHFYPVDNDYILCYGKTCDDPPNMIITVVNLDPYHTQAGTIQIPIKQFGISPKEPFLVHELLSDTKYIWQGESNYLELDPLTLPANILRIQRRLRREQDFDYYL